MIFPHPETDLSLSILVLGSEILSEHKKSVLIDNALMSFLKKDKKRTPELFLDTLTFLYTLGMVELQGYKIKFQEKQPKKATKKKQLKQNGYSQTSLF